jgi:hypothetical protein
MEIFKMSRVAILLATIVASVAVASVSTANADDTAPPPPVHHHHHHRAHPVREASKIAHHPVYEASKIIHHPVHETSEVFHKSTGTQPVSPKPEPAN